MIPDMLPLRAPVLVHLDAGDVSGEVRGRCWNKKAEAAVYDVLLSDGTWLPYVPAERVEAVS